jgi:hypothetical protein
MAEELDLPGLIRSTELVATDVLRAQERDSVVEQFGKVLDDFDERNPFAPSDKRARFLHGEATKQAATRWAQLEAAERLADSTFANTTAEIERAKMLPSELTLLEQRKNATYPSDTTRLLATMLDEQREVRIFDVLARSTVEETVKAYEQAVQRQDTGTLRILEREILAGLPQISTRKSTDPTKTAMAFTKLRTAVVAAQTARVPPDLLASRGRLEAHAAKLRTWLLTMAPYRDRADVNLLTADWRALKLKREQDV